MAASEPKTKPTTESVDAFLDRIPDAARREDCRTVMRMMTEIAGAPPVMWGTGIVGFGSYRYTYASGHHGDWPVAGFSPRKQDLTLYLMSGFDAHAALMARLGKCKTGKSCLYLKRLADVDLDVLRQLIAASVAAVRAAYPSGSTS